MRKCIRMHHGQAECRNRSFVELTELVRVQLRRTTLRSNFVEAPRNDDLILFTIDVLSIVIGHFILILDRRLIFLLFLCLLDCFFKLSNPLGLEELFPCLLTGINLLLLLVSNLLEGGLAEESSDLLSLTFTEDWRD